MNHRRFALTFALALLLAACGSAGPQLPESETLVGTQPTAAAITAPSQPTAAATAVPAQATGAPAATAQPTQAEPTAAPTVAPAAPATAAPTAPATAQPEAGGPGELLFLREGSLIALNLGSGSERTLADNVADVAASPDGARLVLLRGTGSKAELWLVGRDGANLARLTSNTRAEATPSWAPDGASIVYASASIDQPYSREWQSWAQWCAASEVREVALATGSETTLAQGCDPAVAPNGKRIAYAAPPAGAAQGFDAAGPAAVNAIWVINRAGQNGWEIAQAPGDSGTNPDAGLLVYAPSWSPDGGRLAYQRFVGYRALVDLGMTEMTGSFERAGEPLYSSAGWALPASFAPGGGRVAITENNYGDARGFGGYDNWTLAVVTLEGSRELFLPSGSIQALGGKEDRLQRAQAGAWSPDGARLAVQLPAGWKPGLPTTEPFGDAEEGPGEIWLWQPGAEPSEQLATGVDFASPILWLP